MPAQYGHDGARLLPENYAGIDLARIEDSGEDQARQQHVGNDAAGA
ncbi:MAG: hypothetical protein N2423_04750 [Novosphingobium sp.]|nr:hypothetical protein [Novosphingobium sp.]